MKKQLLILGLAGVLFASCDPLKAEGDFVVDNVTAENLMNGATFAQFDGIKDESGNITSYVPSETGNYIQYNFPEVAAVTVFYEKGGERKTLAYGRSGGIVYYMPSRGSDPLQTIYFSYVNANGEEVIAQKDFTLSVAQELDPAVKVLVSDAGVKKWKWMPTNVNGGAVWGNGGWLGAPQDGGLDINGAWWGCGVEDGTCEATFSSQANHAGGKYDEFKGGTYALSYMEFNEDGSITAYNPKGEKISSGSFSIKDYDNNKVTNEAEHTVGVLETSEGAILWPFAINKNGLQPTEFQIGYLDAGRMILMFNGTSLTGGDEFTWWSFMSDDDPAILATHEWHWKPTEVNGGAVWGNGAYGAASQDGTGVIANAWWGCGVNDGDCPDKFSGQMQHAGPAYVEGEEYSTSKMVFDEENSTITVFDKDGKQIRQGSYSVDLTPNPDLFTVGTLNTSEGTILWPFAINMNGYQPTVFSIAYFGADALILQYSEEGTAWSPCTWWSFGK